jgi:heptosyltransferase-3
LLFISLTEHIGDLVAAEPVARHLREENPEAMIYWVVDEKYNSLINSNPHIDKAITVSSFSEWVFLKHFVPKKKLYDLHINNKVCSKHGLILIKKNPSGITTDNYYDKGNLLFCFSRSAGLEIPFDIAPKLYKGFTEKHPSPFSGNYFVLHTSANTDDRMWGSKNWNHLADFIFTQFPGISLVEIGFTNKINSGDQHYINYCGEKDLAELAALIKGTKLFIGGDSSFAHFANALEKEGFILIGKINNFRRYMPYSGKYLKEKEANIFYFDEELSKLPFENIKSKLEQKIRSVL